MVNVVKNGFNISFDFPFVERTPEPNRPSSIKHRDFVAQELHKLVAEGAIVPCERSELLCISPLMVAEGKKLRLVLDLSYLNKFLPKTRFRLEDLGSIIHLLPKNGFLTKFDFRSGYHHVKIHPDSQAYLGFYWDNDNLAPASFYKFVVLPFGLSTAPWLFTKLFRPLVTHWRTQGIPITLYLDDGLIYAENSNLSQEFTQVVTQDLARAGVQIAVEKSVLEPVQRLQFLGCEIDLKDFSIAISQERIEKTLSKLHHLLKSKAPSIHDRMRFMGCIISMYLVVPDAVLLSRATSTVIAESQSADLTLSTRVAPNQGEKEEWRDWQGRLNAPVKRSLPDFDPNEGELFFYSDASGQGVGALLRSRDWSWQTSGRFSEIEKLESSTLRELKAVYFGLLSFRDSLVQQKKKVTIHCDNLAAVSIMKKGSMKPHLQKVAKLINEIRAECGVDFTFKWVPRELNCEADELSREKDFGDWGIKDTVAKIMMNRFGKCTVDLFADNTTTKCERFYSKVMCPFSSGTDAFENSAAWDPREFVWCVPPPNLLPKVLFSLRKFQSRGILGMPLWKSLSIWPIIRKRNGSFKNFVVDYFEFGKGADILIPSKSGTTAFDSSQTKSPFIFLKVDFRKP